jgi:hypothetical protein
MSGQPQQPRPNRITLDHDELTRVAENGLTDWLFYGAAALVATKLEARRLARSILEYMPMVIAVVEAAPAATRHQEPRP